MRLLQLNKSDTLAVPDADTCGHMRYDKSGPYRERNDK